MQHVLVEDSIASSQKGAVSNVPGKQGAPIGYTHYFPGLTTTADIRADARLAIGASGVIICDTTSAQTEPGRRPVRCH